jgi:AraC-like DNA-binding protein
VQTFARVDIPHGNSRRTELLREEWARKVSSPVAAAHLVFPRHAVGDYHGHARRHRLPGVTVVDQYSDAVQGVSGGDVDGEPQVVMHVMRTGSLWLAQGDDVVGVGQGLLCIRDTSRPWRFRFDRSSTMRVVLISRDTLRSCLGKAALPALTVLHRRTPGVRLLLSHLDQLTRPVVPDSAHEYTPEMLAAVLSGDGVELAAELQQSLADAARRIADAALRRADLSPSMIAAALAVSVRTLHRAFADTEESIMGYVRRRRLEMAAGDLAGPARPTVSEVATHWHFTDSSHFSRSFTRRYGIPPSHLRARASAADHD